MANESSPRDDIGALTAMAQLTALITPILYILGQKYSSSFFNTLGSGWVASQINLQETIYYSLQISIPILIAAFLTLEFLLEGMAYEKIRKAMLCICASAVALLTILNFTLELNYSYLLAKIVNYSFCALYGSYIAEVFIASRKKKNFNFRSAVGWIVGSTVVLFGNAGMLGDSDAMNALEFPETKFPLIAQNINNGKPQFLRLVSRVGDKYLLMDQAQGRIFFRIESNLDGYMIQSMGKYRQ